MDRYELVGLASFDRITITLHTITLLKIVCHYKNRVRFENLRSLISKYNVHVPVVSIATKNASDFLSILVRLIQIH